MVGFKYKMSNIQAAIGCAQIERVEDLIAEKRSIFEAYLAKLSELPVLLNPEPAGCINGYWMPTIVSAKDSKFSRSKLLQKMKAKGIDARVFFWPLSALDGVGRKAFDLPYFSYQASHCGVNLPSSFGLDRNNISLISSIILDFFENES